MFPAVLAKVVIAEKEKGRRERGKRIQLFAFYSSSYSYSHLFSNYSKKNPRIGVSEIWKLGAGSWSLRALRLESD